MREGHVLSSKECKMKLLKYCFTPNDLIVAFLKTRNDIKQVPLYTT